MLRSRPVLFVLLMGLIPLSETVAAMPEPVTVTMKDGKGSEIGTAKLTETARGVKIALHLTGLPPGVKAIHFHETGECAAPTFESAGGHFNPSEKDHGKKAKNGEHAGDLENVKVGKDGALKVNRESRLVSLGEGTKSLRRAGGTAIVIHADADDYHSQPAGNAGDRIACGVIPPR